MKLYFEQVVCCPRLSSSDCQHVQLQQSEQAQLLHHDPMFPEDKSTKLAISTDSHSMHRCSMIPCLHFHHPLPLAVVSTGHCTLWQALCASQTKVNGPTRPLHSPTRSLTCRRLLALVHIQETSRQLLHVSHYDLRPCSKVFVNKLIVVTSTCASCWTGNDADSVAFARKASPDRSSWTLAWWVYVHVLAQQMWCLVAKPLLCTLLPPALHYEVLLKETRPTNEQGPSHHGKVATGPSQERIDTCFQVFGE